MTVAFADGGISTLISPVTGTALQDVTQISGQVKLSNGDTWTARTAGAVPIPQGSPIAVIAINGATATVRPVND